MQHSQRILNVFKDVGVSPYKVSKETGISESLFSKWKANPTSEISSKNLAKIADYLDVSIDYLLGRTDVPEVNRGDSMPLAAYGEIAAFGGKATRPAVVEDEPETTAKKSR